MAEENEDKKVYDEDYVKGLRDENAKFRIRARENENKVVELQKQHAELNEKLNAVDFDEIKRLRDEKKAAEKAELEKEKERLLAEQNYEKLLDTQKAELEVGFESERSEMAKSLEDAMAKINELTEQYQNVVSQHKKTLIESEVVSAAAKNGAYNPLDIELRLAPETDVQIIDGKETVVFVDSNGEPVYQDGKLVTVAQKVEQMKQDESSAYLFMSDKQGAGSKTTSVNNDSGIKNPWKSETFNLTEQFKITDRDPDLAKRLMTEANK